MSAPTMVNAGEGIRSVGRCDSLIYGDIAKTWMQTGVYGFGQGGGGALPTLIRLPGYPMFLAASFRLFGMEHYTAVMYAQSLIDLVTCLLVGALAGRLFGHRAGLAALWLAALCPFTASYAAYPLARSEEHTSELQSH